MRRCPVTTHQELDSYFRVQYRLARVVLNPSGDRPRRIELNLNIVRVFERQFPPPVSVIGVCNHDVEAPFRFPRIGTRYIKAERPVRNRGSDKLGNAPIYDL